MCDRTVLHTLKPGAQGVTAMTEAGATVRARHVVLAMGYANQRWLEQRVARNRSSYAFITDPIDADTLGRLQRTMVWRAHARTCTCAPPATAACWWVGWTTPSISRRGATARAAQGRKLMDQLLHWFPRLDPVPAFSWAGTFAETADGLPFFGPHAQWGPRVHSPWPTAATASPIR